MGKKLFTIEFVFCRAELPEVYTTDNLFSC